MGWEWKQVYRFSFVFHIHTASSEFSSSVLFNLKSRFFPNSKWMTYKQISSCILLKSLHFLSVTDNGQNFFFLNLFLLFTILYKFYNCRQTKTKDPKWVVRYFIMSLWCFIYIRIYFLQVIISVLFLILHSCGHFTWNFIFTKIALLSFTSRLH